MDGLPAGHDTVPIPISLRARLERFFEADLSAVCVSEDSLPTRLGALAVTSGDTIHVHQGVRDLIFGPLVRILVHEVAHCLQQRRHTSNHRDSTSVVVEQPDLELEANAAADLFVCGGLRFEIAPRDFGERGAVLQCIETAALRAWLGPAEYEQLKAALSGAFGALLAMDEGTLRRFNVPGNAAATRAALVGFFNAIRPLNPQQTGDLCRLLSPLSGSEVGEVVQGLPGIPGPQILQFIQAQQPVPAGYLHTIVRVLQPLTGMQIIALVNNLRNTRNFTITHIYLLCSHLRTLTGNAIQNFLNLYAGVNGPAMLPVLNKCCMGVPALTAAQLNGVVVAVGGLPGIVAGFTIHGVLRLLYDPLGPARLYAISQISGRCLVRCEQMIGGNHISAVDFTAVMNHATFFNHDQRLHDFLQAAVDANLTSADWAWLLKVITGQENPVLPANTLARKAALFIRYHCGQRASDLPVGDDTTVERTTDNNPHNICTYRTGSWKAVTKVHVRLSQRGVNHFRRRHFIEHFDFTDIKNRNTFFPPGTNITDETLFLVAASTIEQLHDTNINNGFVKHNVAVPPISYKVGVYWTAVPGDTPAQPVARFDQFFITNAPANQVIEMTRAEVNVIELLLTALGKLV